MKYSFVFQDNIAELFDGTLCIKSKEENLLLYELSLTRCMPFLDSVRINQKIKNFFCMFCGSFFLTGTLCSVCLTIFLCMNDNKHFISGLFIFLILFVFTYFFFSHIRKEQREYILYSFEYNCYITVGGCCGKKTNEEELFVDELNEELKRCSRVEKKMEQNMDPFSPEYHSISALCGISDKEKYKQHIPLYHK